MGIYISEINMPKGEGSKLVLQIFPNGEVYDEHGFRLGITKWAGAIPIPPHGDLIDRGYAIATACSGLIRTLPTTESGENWIRVAEVRESIKSAPTIIPAEECEI